MGVKLLIFSYLSVETFVLGAQKNCLIETVLLSTHNKCEENQILITHSASLVIQQAFLKPCLINLISKDTHLVLSTYLTN